MPIILFALLWFVAGIVATGLFALLGSTTPELLERDAKQHTAQRAIAVGLIVVLLVVLVISFIYAPC